MEQQIILSETEIAQIIAGHYDCDVKNVAVEAQVSYEGYGLMEHPVTRCRAKVTITKEEKHTHA